MILIYSEKIQNLTKMVFNSMIKVTMLYLQLFICILFELEFIKLSSLLILTIQVMYFRPYFSLSFKSTCNPLCQAYEVFHLDCSSTPFNHMNIFYLQDSSNCLPLSNMHQVNFLKLFVNQNGS